MNSCFDCAKPTLKNTKNAKNTKNNKNEKNKKNVKNGFEFSALFQKKIIRCAEISSKIVKNAIFAIFAFFAIFTIFAIFAIFEGLGFRN